MTERPGWFAAHVHYRGDLDALLREAVAPLVRALAADFFFLRYWDGGSHLRLRLRGGDQVAVARHLDAYLAAHPAPETTSQEEYARVAPVLAAREGMTGHLTTLRPNNTVEFAAYRPETAKYGTGDALRAVERHFVESSRYALDVLDRRPTGNQRELAVLGVLLLAWYAARPLDEPPGEPVDDELIGAVEALCRGWRGGRDLPEELVAEEYGRVRERVAGLAGALRDLVPDPDAPGSSMRAWAATFDRLAAALPPPDRLRVLDTCAHLAANRLGVSMAAEVRLRLLAARALREVAPVGRR
uniref:Dehydratase n=1 Tax=Nonomuraea sp. WU8817 TaxID=653884 RepID=C6G217_9ACTN|nr:dehydratase [Nonomuraea sp. WU8817]